MLSIRMQRTGRKGHAQYRVVVQDSRQSPTSGKFVARLGHYDPHTKVAVLDKEKASTFLSNGAQPSDRIVALFTAEKIELPSWVKQPVKKERSIRNPEKLRRNRPAEEPVAEAAEAEAPAEAAPEAPVAEEPTTEEAPAETEPLAEETPAEEAAPEADAPAEEAPAETEEPAADAEKADKKES